MQEARVPSPVPQMPAVGVPTGNPVLRTWRQEAQEFKLTLCYLAVTNFLTFCAWGTKDQTWGLMRVW